MRIHHILELFEIEHVFGVDEYALAALGIQVIVHLVDHSCESILCLQTLA